jgi:hypothetical protein
MSNPYSVRYLSTGVSGTLLSLVRNSLLLGIDAVLYTKVSLDPLTVEITYSQSYNESL